MAITQAITSGLSGGFDIGLGLYDAYNKTRNYKQQVKVSEQNLGYQKDVLNWQKSAQRNTWKREDNAVQRRVNDMKTAGINPILAAGQAAQSASPINVTAPQKQTPQRGEIRAVQAQQKMLAMLNTFQMVKNLKYIDEQIKTQQFQQKDLAASALNKMANRNKAQTENEKMLHNLKWYRDKGVPVDYNFGAIGKEIAPIVGALEKFVPKIPKGGKKVYQMSESEKRSEAIKVVEELYRKKKIDVFQKDYIIGNRDYSYEEMLKRTKDIGKEQKRFKRHDKFVDLLKNLKILK